MQRLESYDQYAGILAAFKAGRARCQTNRLFTRDELTALIADGRLYCEACGDVLWCFVHEGYYYAASFYAPTDAVFCLPKQDMDVVVELTGNQARYPAQWERALLDAGFRLGDRYLEWAAPMDAIIDAARQQDATRRARLGDMTWRKGTRADASELQALWELRLDKRRYTLAPMSGAEWDEMERTGRCDLICGADGRIQASYLYVKRGKTACAFHLAALDQGRGLGSAVFYRLIVTAHEDGCNKFACWVREDNEPSVRLHQHVLSQSGKFYQQLIF